MDEKKTTNTLMNILKSAKVSDISDYLDENPEVETAFSVYMRQMFKRKGVSQQDVFTKTGISYGYGYKIISGEKHTRQRDLIIEICLAARFSLDEVQRALKLYKMPQLYPGFSRDAVLIIAFNQEIYELSDVNRLITEHGFEQLYQGKET